VTGIVIAGFTPDTPRGIAVANPAAAPNTAAFSPGDKFSHPVVANATVIPTAADFKSAEFMVWRYRILHPRTSRFFGPVRLSHGLSESHGKDTTPPMRAHLLLIVPAGFLSVYQF
jgi:hypothetical protein